MTKMLETLSIILGLPRTTVGVGTNRKARRILK